MAGVTVPVFEGRCHCGAVTFRIEHDLSDRYRCDCSLCTMKGVVMANVPERAFQLLSGEQVLSEYRWNTKIARHYFCSVCGIYTFHRKRALPDHFAINMHCLDGLDLAGLAVRSADGKAMTVRPGGRTRWTGPIES